MEMKKGVSVELRRWFFVHFVADMVFGIPLIFFPEFVLNLLNIFTRDFLTARLVGAALLGIGGASLLNYRGCFEEYRIMLNLKIIWAISAIIAISLSLFESFNRNVYFLLGIFIVFLSVWIYYRGKLGSSW